MIAKLPKQATIFEDNDNNSKTNSSAEESSEEVIHEMLIPCKKSNKVVSKKSPKKTKKSNSKVCNAYIHYISLTYPFIFENNGKYLYIIYLGTSKDVITKTRPLRLTKTISQNSLQEESS